MPPIPLIHRAMSKPWPLSDGRTLGRTTAATVTTASASASDSNMITILFENELSMTCSLEE